MEENLLKYITGQGTPTTEDIEPQNVLENTITLDGYYDGGQESLITNDNNYFIIYGAPGRYSNSTIEVYNINSLDNEEYLYKFGIDDVGYQIIDLEQDEDGRFYGIGRTTDLTNFYYYLILFNNFIQDGELKIRKVYSAQIMEVNNPTFRKVIKKKGSADYYIDNLTNIIHYHIDITNGNKTEVYNIIDEGTISAGIQIRRLFMQNDILILMVVYKNTYETKAECKKLTIDTTEEIQENYYLKVLKTYQSTAETNYILSSIQIDEFLFKVPISELYTPYTSIKISFEYVDLNGNTTLLQCDEEFAGTGEGLVWFCGNYFLFNHNNKNMLLYNNGTDIFKFYETNENLNIYNIKHFKNYNIDCLIGLSGDFHYIYYFKNIYSAGYSSISYYNNNFMIPQYLNLYENTNDDTSLIFSRNVSNRFIVGNQLTAIFNIPNYMLNNETIKREIVNSQTNLNIEDNNKQYSKNRFESLYMTYMYNMYVKDNTNEENLINLEGSNRIADSVWNSLDYQASPITKARITYEDETQDIISIGTPTINQNEATYTFSVEGNIIKIEYMSNDENTVYATYRCNLTGNNTITQKIKVMEG